MADPPPLELEGLRKSFGGVRAVDDLSVTFTAGRVTSLIGPNGAGKTTVFNMVNGFLRPDRGVIRYRERIDGLDPRAIADRGIGRLFQDIRLFRSLSVLDNLLLAKRRHPGEDPAIVLCAPGRVARAERSGLEAAERWLEFMSLGELRDRLSEDLSYGQQKLVAIARLLAGGFEVLLLDEPTAGVAPGMVRHVLGIIRQLASLGKTIIVVEHNMTVVVEISDWVYFMDEGRLVTSGPAAVVLDDPRVREAYLGASQR